MATPPLSRSVAGAAVPAASLESHAVPLWYIQFLEASGQFLEVLKKPNRLQKRRRVQRRVTQARKHGKTWDW